MLSADIHFIVLCLPCGDGKALYTDHWIFHALIYTAVCCSCTAGPGSFAGYIAWLYAAGCCTCAVALAKTAMCIALLYAAVHSACTAAPDSLARYVALI